MSRKNNPIDIIEAQESAVNAIASAYAKNGFKGISPIDLEYLEEGDDEQYLLDSFKIGGTDTSIADIFSNIVDESLNQDPQSVARALMGVKPLFAEVAEQGTEYLADSIGGLNGSEIVPQLIILNFTLFLNSSIPELVGNIPMDREKTVMYTMDMVADQPSGQVQKNEEFSTMNMQQPFAIKGRHQKFVATGGDDTFEMGVYHRVTDAIDDTAKIHLNKTRATFYGNNKELNDYEVAQGATSCNPSAYINGKKVEMVIDYAGKITINVEAGALEEGDIIIVETSIDPTDNMTKNRALTLPLITPHRFIPHNCSIGVKINTFDEATVNKNTGLDILGASNLFNLQKTIEEVNFNHLSMMYAVSDGKIWKKTLDLTQFDAQSNVDAYQHLSAEVQEISNEIGTSTGWTSSVALMGGSALSKALRMSKSPSRNASLSGIKPIGLLDNSWVSYYNPSHDDYMPLVDADGNENADSTLNVYSQILVFGYGKKEEQRVVLGGFPSPLRQEFIPFQEESTRLRVIEGNYVSQLNTIPRSHKMVYRLLVKGIVR